MFDPVFTLTKGVDYTTPYQEMVGETAGLGDIVALGIEPHEPYGRIIGFDKSKVGRGSVIVQSFGGDIRGGALGVAYSGYCKRDDWDGPTPNTAKDLMPGLTGGDTP